jgi:ADP-ribosylglycohydrolase
MSLKPLPSGYVDRVFSGVLGKVIGVYLGRPFEQWSHERIERELGEVWWFQHEKLGVPLIVADDDITGTFTFIRALEEHGFSYDITPEQIGQTWLNNLVEGKSVLWWGGRGRSAEHTAYLNLKEGVPAPESGSIARNGPIMPQQIGGQIFIDGWGMLCPGQPVEAADLARRAASVSHDGEGIYGGMAVAAMVSSAFGRKSIDELLDVAVSVIPVNCLVAEVHRDVRAWAAEDQDWRATLRRIQAKWGYDQWPGGCHMLPNHAIIVLALVYGEGDFNRSLMIACTAGYDTDCNAGNVGAILGLLETKTFYDESLRNEVADRLLMPTADPAGLVSDVPTMTMRVVNAARQMRGMSSNHGPKLGGVFGQASSPDSGLNYSACGWTPYDSPECRGWSHLIPQGRWFEADDLPMGRTARWSVDLWARPAGGGYGISGSPRIAPGQVIQAKISNTVMGAVAWLWLDAIRADGSTARLRIQLPSHEEVAALLWTPDLPPDSAALSLGLEFIPLPGEVSRGCVFIESIDWSGEPTLDLPAGPAPEMRQQWVDATDQEAEWWGDAIACVQNRGRGMLLHGQQAWRDIRLSAEASCDHGRAFGLAIRVMGLRRYVALEFDGSEARIVRRRDDEVATLGAWPFAWPAGSRKHIWIEAQGDIIRAGADGELWEAMAPDAPQGCIALWAEEGAAQFRTVRVRPSNSPRHA